VVFWDWWWRDGERRGVEGKGVLWDWGLKLSCQVRKAGGPPEGPIRGSVFSRARHTLYDV
jgi:hypothetical protein